MTEHSRTIVHGDLVRPRPAGNVHVADVVHPAMYGVQRVTTACGKEWGSAVLDPADRGRGRQCQTCRDAT